MICNQCGANVADNADFCTNCGNQFFHDSTDETFEDNVEETTEVIDRPESSSALVFGILAVISFLGLIFGIIAIVLSNKPNQKNAKVAKTLGIVGVVFGIILVLLIIIGMLLPQEELAYAIL